VTQLFSVGLFTLHSGSLSGFRIDCDALTAGDIEALAALIAASVHPFSRVEGVPRGGLALAEALESYTQSPGGLLIVDDVLTTGASMEEQRAGREAEGVVVFARGLCPAWVWAVFRTRLR
jgi:orotate phosphoribosyltransferase